MHDGLVSGPYSLEPRLTWWCRPPACVCWRVACRHGPGGHTQKLYLAVPPLYPANEKAPWFAREDLEMVRERKPAVCREGLCLAQGALRQTPGTLTCPASCPALPPVFLEKRFLQNASPLLPLLPLPPLLLAQLAEHVDGFSVMTYDYSTGIGKAGPSAPISWVRTNLLLLQKGASESQTCRQQGGLQGRSKSSFAWPRNSLREHSG